MLNVPWVSEPADVNYIINPAHPYFSSVEIVDIKPFTFDERLLGN